MKALALLLLVLVIGSSLYLVKTSYESRRLFAAIDRAQGEARQLDIEYKRLDAERHLRLRLASAVTNRSSQVILTDLLDEYLASLPEIDAMASRLPAACRQALSARASRRAMPVLSRRLRAAVHRCARATGSLSSTQHLALSAVQAARPAHISILA